MFMQSMYTYLSLRFTKAPQAVSYLLLARYNIQGFLAKPPRAVGVLFFASLNLKLNQEKPQPLKSLFIGCRNKITGQELAKTPWGCGFYFR